MKKLYLLLLCILANVAYAQDYVAVYTTGNIVYDDARTFSSFITASLINTGRYKGVERADAFLAELNAELLAAQSDGGAAGGNPVALVGKRFGARYVCVAQVAPVLDAFQITAYIMDVETAGAVFQGEAVGVIKSVADLSALSDNLVANMLYKSAAPQAAPQAQAVQTAPEPAVYEPPPAQGGSVLDAATPAPAYEPPPAEGPPPARMKAPKEKGRPPHADGWFSAGAGGFFSGDFGGGAKWESGDEVVMPYSGLGGYLFFDAVYAEVFFGFQGGGGKWAAGSEIPAADLPEMSRGYVNFGLYGKYPVGAGVKFFPLVGIDYYLSTGGKIEMAGGGGYEFDGKFAGAAALSALWVKAGCGLDIPVAAMFYLRVEALYGLRGPSKFEEDYINRRLKFDYSGSGKFKNSLQGHGADAKLGLGVKF